MEVETEDEARELEHVLTYAEPGPSAEEASAALGRWRSTNAGPSSELDQSDPRWKLLNPGADAPLEGLESIEQGEHFQDRARRDEEQVVRDDYAQGSALETARQKRRPAEVGPDVMAAERGVEAAMGPQKIREMFPEPTEVSEGVDPMLGSSHLAVEPEEALALSEATRKRDEAYRHLPNASKDPNRYAPPEFIPEGVGVDGALSAEPFFEPTVDEFLEVKGGELAAAGVDPKTLDENSHEFKQYADEKWQRTYSRAAALNKPVTRIAYMNTPTWRQALQKKALPALDRAGSAALGVIGGTIPGADTLISGALHESERDPNAVIDEAPSASAVRHPAESIVGTIGGAINPFSIGSKIAAPAYRSMGGLEKGASLGKRLGAAAYAGGASGAATGILGTAGAALSPDPSDPEDVAQRPLLDVAGGVAGGVGGELIGSAAKSGVDALRRTRLGEKLKLAEKAGYETSALHGLEPGSELKPKIEELRETGTHPYVQMAEEVSERGAQTMHDVQAGARKELGENVEKYYSAFDNKPAASRGAPKLIQRTFEAIKSMRTKDGDVPFSNTANLRKELKKMTTARVIDESEEVADATYAKGRAYTLNELFEMGFSKKDVAEMAGDRAPKWLKGWLKEGGDAEPVARAEGFELDPLFGIREHVPGMEIKAPQTPANRAGRRPRIVDMEDSSAATVRAGKEMIEGPGGSLDASEPVTVLDDIVPETDTVRVVLEPVKMSPRQFDAAVDDLVRAAGEAETSSGTRHPIYKQLMEAAFEDRRSFPSHPRFAPKNREFEISDDRGGKRKVAGWAGLKARHAETLENNRNLATGAGFPAEMPARRGVQLKGPKGEELVKPKTSGGEPVPALSSDEWKKVQRIVMNLHGPGNQDAPVAQKAWEALAQEGGFADDLARVAGTRYGEEIINQGSGLRLVAGSGMTPSLYTNVAEKIQLRIDPAMKATASIPTDDLSKVIGPNLKRLLGMMRRGDKPAKRAPDSVTLGGQAFGMRGGQQGARGAAVSEREKGDITPEDLKNLQKLLQARQ